MLQYQTEVNTKTYVLAGEDAYSIAKSLEEFKNSLDATDLLEANYSSVEAGNITPADLGLIISASPFLATKRLVVVRGLFERFEKQSRRKKKVSADDTDTHDSLVKSMAGVIRNKPATTELVIVAEKIAAGNPLLKLLKPDLEVRSYPALAGKGLEGWITEYASSQGGKITPAAAQLLARLVGSDLWSMSNEIGKLVIYTGGGEVDVETITRMVQVTPEANIFYLIDAVVAGRVSAATMELEKLLSNGASSSQIINMLARQMRMIAIAKDMLERGSQSVDIRKRLGIKHDFIMQKVAQKARVFTSPAIYTFYLILVEADLDIKTGKLEPDLVLSILIEKLVKIANPSNVSRC